LSDIAASLILDIQNKEDCTKVRFRQPIIFEYKTIFEAFTKRTFANIEDLKFEQLTATIGGYDTGHGFSIQSVVWIILIKA